MSSNPNQVSRAAQEWAARAEDKDRPCSCCGGRSPHRAAAIDPIAGDDVAVAAPRKRSGKWPLLGMLAAFLS